MEHWFAVTYRAPAEMTVWVRAKNKTQAKERAEDGQYDDATPVEFVRGRPYTMKVRWAPDFEPSEEFRP